MLGLTDSRRDADTMSKIITKLLLVFHLAASLAFAQAPQNPKPHDDATDVVKVYTDLVQTDVMVFDRQGHFADGLKREDFEVRIDGKVQPITSFDLVRAGTISEDARLAAARGAAAPTRPNQTATRPEPLDRGRPIFFFVDDMHLSPTSLDQARKLLTRYIERDLKQNDEAEIITASGRLGFLQQLTDNKTVLRTAVERLSSRPGIIRDLQRPPMSEYQALQISRGDPDTTGYFVDEILKDNRMLPRSSAEDEIARRSAMILEQAAYLTGTTLSSLDSLIRAANKLPGRKLIFLISDGFFIDTKNSDSSQRIRLLTSAASRSGAVIYSIDARGLIANLADAGTPVAADRTGRLQRGGLGEIFSSQDALNALAHDTGGRALFNTNDLHTAVDSGLKETSVYYLLAWRPTRDGDSAGKFRRLEVALPGKSDLTVRVRRGFYDLDPQRQAEKRKGPIDLKPEPPNVQAKLREAIVAPYPETQLPISLSLNYLDTPDKGIALTASMQVPGEFLSFAADNGKEKAQVDLAGAVFNDRGEASGRFSEQVTILTSQGDKAASRNLTYNHTVPLGPGLYQVRMAGRDAVTGNVGSAAAWIEIPDLNQHGLALSSVIVGERSETGSLKANALNNQSPDPVNLSIDRRFKRDSFLRYLVFVYNSARVPLDSAPDVAMQMQILRDNQPVATTTLKKVATDGVQDLQRLPYAAEIPLAGMPAGRYVLQLTAIDRIARTSSSQQVRFEIQ
jgi:VWFA-related protein